jgi:protein-disulfide isomerase
LVVFCDFECQYCRRLKPRIDELERTHGSNLRVVFKQLPLGMHENSRLAAKAALAAHQQGRFWQLHDLMFRSEPPLDREQIESLAARAGLDLGRFRAALDSEELERQLDRDLIDADRVGARGTPTSFVNGKKITGAQPLTTFERAVSEALGR